MRACGGGEGRVLSPPTRLTWPAKPVPHSDGQNRMAVRFTCVGDSMRDDLEFYLIPIFTICVRDWP